MLKLLSTLFKSKSSSEIFNSIRIEALVAELERQGFDRRAYEQRVETTVHKLIDRGHSYGRQIPEGV